MRLSISSLCFSTRSAVAARSASSSFRVRDSFFRSSLMVMFFSRSSFSFCIRTVRARSSSELMLIFFFLRISCWYRYVSRSSSFSHSS
uniref:Putative secreted protein n=1 Tax=Ixodes ricinus TaxID=34613 RepID=A0A6B0UAM8_IXORI